MDVNAHLEEIAALAVSIWRDTDPSVKEYSKMPESARAYWRDLVRDTAFAMDSRSVFESGQERACALAIRYHLSVAEPLTAKEQNDATPVTVGSEGEQVAGFQVSGDVVDAGVGEDSGSAAEVMTEEIGGVWEDRSSVPDGHKSLWDYQRQLKAKRQRKK